MVTVILFILTFPVCIFPQANDEEVEGNYFSRSAAIIFSVCIRMFLCIYLIIYLFYGNF